MTTKSAQEVERYLTVAEAIELVCRAAERDAGLLGGGTEYDRLMDAIDIVREIF